MHEHARKRMKSQSGVALLLSLGFAALLLVLVLAFATNAMIEQKIASANSSRSQSRILGDVALTRALAAMRYYAAAQNNENYDGGIFRLDNVVSRSNSQSYDAGNQFFVGLSDCLSKVNIDGNAYDFLKLGGDLVYFYPNSQTDIWTDPDAAGTGTAAERKVDLQQMQWQYIYSGSGSTADPNRIVGRYAYTVLPDMGTLHKSLFRNYPQNADMDGKSNERHGKTIHEFPLSPLFNTLDDGNGGVIADAFSKICQAFTNNYDTTYHPRQLLDSIFSNEDLRANSSAPRRLYSMLDTSATVSEFSSKFRNNNAFKDLFLLSQGEIAKYAHDYTTGGDGTITIGNASVLDAAGIKNALPYLSRIGDNADKGNFGSAADMQNQIAANLVDYVDSDNVPTSDILASQWAPDSGPRTTHPAYTGNERTAYVNEIAVNFETKWRARLDNETKMEAGVPVVYRWWDDVYCAARLHVAGEIANYFPETADGNYTLRVYVSGNIYVRCWIYIRNHNGSNSGQSMDSGGFGYFNLEQLSLDGMKYVDIPVTVKVGDGGSAERTGYFTGSSSLPEVSFARDINKPGVPSLKEYKRKDGNGNNQIEALMGMDNVQIGQVVLLKDGNPVDYVKPFPKLTNNNMGISWNWNNTNHPGQDVKTSTITFDDTKRCATFAYSAKDARANLNNGDWLTHPVEYGKTDDFDSDFSPATLGTYNSSAIVYEGDFNGMNGVDPLLNSTDPTKYAPYFIRNAAMTTAGELSLIHRGEPSRTLNLAKAADPDKTSGVTYADGDAGILDQIRLSDLSAEEKIDMNTRDKLIWQMIFAKLNYTDIGLDAANALNEPSGNVISKDDAAKLANAMNKLIRKEKWFFESPSQLLGQVTVGGVSKTRLRAVIDEAAASYGLAAPVKDLTALQQESLVAKVAPVLKASRLPDSFYVLVIAQGITDVGGDGAGVQISRIDSSGATHTKTDCRLNVFDYDYVAVGGENEAVYYDVINSEIKLLAKIKRTEEADGRSVFNVVSIDYLTE